MDTEKQRYANFGIDNTPYFTFKGKCLWARVVSVYDGDTMTIVFPVGDNMWKFNVRMFGIDTCEMKSKDGANKDLALKARNRIVELASGRPLANASAAKKDVVKHLTESVCLVWVECLEFDKYGRILVKLYPSRGDKKTFSDILIEEKLAYPYFGETKLTEADQVSTLATAEA